MVFSIHASNIPSQSFLWNRIGFADPKSKGGFIIANTANMLCILVVEGDQGVSLTLVACKFGRVGDLTMVGYVVGKTTFF